MQSVIIGSIGISPIINSITTISTSIFTILKNIKLSKNNQEDVMAVLNKTDIEATVTLLQNIISDISCLPYTEYFGNNKFIIIALNNVKESIADIELELIDLKKKINYNSSLYFFVNLRSYDLLNNLNNIETKISVLDRRSNYLFKSLDLCKHF